MTDAQKEIINLLGDIKAAQGGGAVGVTSVSGTAPIASSGGATPAISIAPATPSDPGSMSAADKTKLDGLSAHSGGVIGTASFDASGASIASLVNDGVITGVVYTSLGVFEVTITLQPNTNYIVVLGSSQVAGQGVTCNYGSKTTTVFVIQTYDPRSEVFVDPALVSVAVLRLSQ